MALNDLVVWCVGDSAVLAEDILYALHIYVVFCRITSSL